jgi:PAS domain S-box-containing protein
VASDRPLELESFLGTVPGMIFRSRLSPEPYFIEFVSDEMTSIAGYSASDFIGPDPKRNWAELIHPDDREASRAKVLGAPTDGSITKIEYRIQRADGSYAWILSRLRKFVAEDESLWVHGAALDVTARHEGRICAGDSKPSTPGQKRSRSHGLGSSRRVTRRGAASSATCTTGLNSG